LGSSDVSLVGDFKKLFRHFRNVFYSFCRIAQYISFDDAFISRLTCCSEFMWQIKRIWSSRLLRRSCSGVRWCIELQLNRRQVYILPELVTGRFLIGLGSKLLQITVLPYWAAVADLARKLYSNAKAGLWQRIIIFWLSIMQIFPRYFYTLQRSHNFWYFVVCLELVHLCSHFASICIFK